jgi:hypothetical protein
MLERLIDYMNGHAGIRWVTMEEVASKFRQRFPFASEARPEDR